MHNLGGGGGQVGDPSYPLAGQPSSRGPQMSRVGALGRGDPSGNVLYSSYNGSLRASGGVLDEGDYDDGDEDDLAMLRSANVS